jgi:putative nucleotidyltransferase with HDIG domain
MASPSVPPASSAERLAEQLQRIITKRIEEDSLVLPMLPLVATKCLEVLKNPNFSLKDLAAVIEKDPIVTVQLLRFVNSAAIGTREPIKKVQDAVARLGVNQLRTFLVEAATRRLFESKDTRILTTNKRIWEHSLVVASVAADIAALANSGDAETAYLAGLLHDVGKPVVAAMLLEAERSIRLSRPDAVWISPADFLTVVQKIHRPLGIKLAQKWEVPEPVIRAIRDCDDYDSSERSSAANAVRLANAIVKEQGIYEGEVNKDDVEAMVMIGQSVLGVDISACRQLVGSVRAAVKAYL